MLSPRVSAVNGLAVGPIVGRLHAELTLDGAASLDLGAFRISRFRGGTYKKPSLVS